jgi:hypothetical protein
VQRNVLFFHFYWPIQIQIACLYCDVICRFVLYHDAETRANTVQSYSATLAIVELANSGSDRFITARRHLSLCASYLFFLLGISHHSTFVYSCCLNHILRLVAKSGRDWMTEYSFSGGCPLSCRNHAAIVAITFGRATISICVRRMLVYEPVNNKKTGARSPGIYRFSKGQNCTSPRHL